MDLVANSFVSGWYETLGTHLPVVLGAILVLIIGWVVGRLLGKAVYVVIDKATEISLLNTTEFVGSVKKAGLTLGYLGDVAVRIIVYLIAVLAAVDILNLQYMSSLMSMIIGYIPHIVAFIVIMIAGFILVDYFIDLLTKFHGSGNIEMITPVLFVLRLFLYFITVMLGLSQLMLDLTIIYTFITPIAWGIGLGLGAAIAIIVGFGLKNRSEAIMDQVLAAVLKK
jgi:hypothetical protein